MKQKSLAALLVIAIHMTGFSQESKTNTNTVAQTKGELSPAHPASESEVESMLSDVKRRIVPFTLTEAQNGKFTEQGNTGHMQLGAPMNKQWDALTVKRIENEKSFSVTALAIRKAPAGPLEPGHNQSGNDSLIEVSFFVKEGSANWASGDTGPTVLDLLEPASVSKASDIGFHVVILVDGDVSTAFIEDSGHWTVKKFKGETPKNWPR